MADLEKVIKGLESHIERTVCVNEKGEVCPYFSYEDCHRRLTDDALELLKAHRWRKFEFRELDEEEKAEHPNWCYIMVNTPDDGEEILVSNGRYVWKDEFINDGDWCYLDSDHDMENCWWMPLPEPPKEGDSE